MNANRALRADRSLEKDFCTAAGAFLAGVLLALPGLGRDGSAGANLPVLLLRPWVMLGEGLRAWSLSGAGGNAAAWAVVLVLSMLPCAYGLLARRKQRRRSDRMFPLLSVTVFGCLYLLVNPSWITHPLLAASAGAELQRMTPAAVLLGVLLACVLIRWAEGLTEDRPLSAVLKWMRRLLLLIMLSEALTMGNTFARALHDIVHAAPTPHFPAYAAALPEADGWMVPLRSLAELIPGGFLIAAMHDARRTCSAFEEYGFHEKTELCARALAMGAKRILIALCACMAAENVAVMLMGRLLAELSISLKVPLGEMAFACGMLLLARCIAAACRIKRENELII